MNLAILWLVLAAVFLVIELATVSLCSIWFTVGALASAASAGLGAPLWLQIVLFLLISGGCFAAMYPRLRSQLRRNVTPTNYDMLIGRVCVVTQRIDELAGTGVVAIAGKTWTARTASGRTVEKDAHVRVEDIEGVKLIVTPIKDTVNV